MGNSSETKVTRRDAILTTGKAAVAFGAAALLAGRLPKIQRPGTTYNEVDGMDLEIPAGGWATVAVTYVGTDPDDATAVTDALGDVGNTPVAQYLGLGLLPIRFV